MNTNKKLKVSSFQGFTLIEMAMVLVVLSILLGGLMGALGQTTENTRRSKTSAQLNMIEEALYGFAQTNGRLPCPSTPALEGRESLTDLADGTCSVYHGLIPSVTLGLSGSTSTEFLLLDAWKNPFRYSIASLDTGSGKIAFTSKDGMSNTFTDSATHLQAGNGLLRVCEDLSDCAGTALADTIPAIVLSMGQNWPTYTSSDEETNAGDGSTTLGAYPVTTTDNFVSTGYSDENFDDMLIWLSPHILFNRLIKAEQLP